MPSAVHGADDEPPGDDMRGQQHAGAEADPRVVKIISNVVKIIDNVVKIIDNVVKIIGNVVKTQSRTIRS